MLEEMPIETQGLKYSPKLRLSVKRCQFRESRKNAQFKQLQREFHVDDSLRYYIP